MSASLNWLNSLGNGFVLFTVRMLIQSSVLILILLLLDFVLRRRIRAVVRYWIWLLVLAKLVLPPSLSSPTGLVSWVGGRLPEKAIVSFVPASGAVVREAAPPAALTPMETTAPPIRANDYSPLQAAERIAAPPMSSAAPVQSVVLPTWQALVLLAWTAAVILMVVLLIQRVFFVRALLAQSQEAPDALDALLEQCRRHMGVHSVAGVRLTGLSASPSVCGLLRPMILMPEHMTRQLDMPQLRSVLFHELAHIQRGDLWINLLQTLLQIVYLYHPLLWWANARIRAIREQAVDEAVLVALGANAEEYPRTLLSISRLAFGRPVLSLRLLGVVESKRALTARIRYMVSRPFPTSARLSLLGLAAIVVMAVVLLPMARGTEGSTRDSSPATSSASSAAERIIHFPKDRSLGLLSLRDAGTYLDQWEGWRNGGPARGDTPVPEGTQRRLSVTEETHENLADLATLRADDLQYLDIRSPQLQDGDLRHLERLTGLQSLILSSSSSARISPMSGEGLAYLKDLKSLRHLRILYTQLTDESLRHLEPLSRLEDLTLWDDEQIHGEELDHLKSLPALRSLSFFRVPVEDRGLEKLKGMERLESLSLQYTRVTDEGLVHLRGLPALKSLVLPPATTDAGLVHLKGLASLTQLFISDARVTDDGLAHLQEMPALMSVSVSCREMNGRGLKYLRDMPGLKRIGLMYDQMDDAGLVGLKGLTAVTSLNLGRNPITDGGLANLEGLTALEYLNLKSTPITDAGLVHLKGLASLKILDLESTAVTDAGLENLKDLTCLQTLRLQGTDIGDVGLAHLKGLKALDTLYLHHTHVSDAGLIHLRGLPSLRDLTLSGTDVTGEGLVHLKDSRSLRHLSIRVPRLSQVGTEYLKEMTWLQELALGEGSIEGKDLMDMKKALPNCTINMEKVTSLPPTPAPASPAGQPALTRPSDSPATPLPTAEPAGGAISGVVVDSRGTPIAGASVTVENKDLLLLPQPEKIGGQIRRVLRADTTQTDSEGRFRFTDLTPGKTPITLAAAGYRTEFALSTSTGTEDLRIVLGEPRPYRHSGVVLDISCRPVGGVEVTFVEETLSGPGKGEDVPPVTVRTDERGQYRFDRLLPPVDRQLVRRFLYARKPGYGAWGYEVDTTGGQPTGQIRLMAEEEVSGVVKDEAGAPIAGATVWLSSGWGYYGPFRFGSTWQHLAPQTTTRADGSFTLGQLPTDSDLSLQVRAEGFASGGVWPIRTGKFGGYAIRRGDSTTIMGGGGDPNAPLMITLQRAVTLRGTVVYESTGKGAPTIRVATQAHKRSEWSETTTNEAGQFELTGVSPVPCNLLVMVDNPAQDAMPEWTAAALRLDDLQPGETRDDLRLTLTKGNIVRGRATDAHGYPLQGIDIAFYSAARPRPGAACQGIYTAPDGTWSYRFPPGEVYIYVRTGIPGVSWRTPRYTYNAVAGRTIENVDFVLNQAIPENSRYRGVQSAAAAPVDRTNLLPPGATAGARTPWPVSAGGNGHFYQGVRMPKPLPWSEADRLATLLGGRLVTITSAAENDFVFRLIDDDTYWYHSYNWRGPWIGALQPPGSAEPDGGWTWITGEPFTYTRWDAGQPNNFNGSPENRVHFGNQRSRIPTWNDVRENFEEVVSFVVEWEQPNGHPE